MSWYRVGTVTVTNGSTTVTGVGTDFVGAVAAGHGFVGPDGRTYEVGAVVSASQLTLATSYLGSTQASASYGIYPTYAQLLQFQQRLDALLTDYESIATGAGIGRFQNGTAALPGMTFEGDLDNGLYLSGANQIGVSTGAVRRLLLSTSAMQVDVPITGSAVQSSIFDTTSGKLMAVGAGGLLLSSDTLNTNEDIDTIDPVSRFMSWSTNSGGHPVNGPDDNGSAGIQISASSTRLMQMLTQVQGSSGNPIVSVRVKDTTFGPWARLFHTRNILNNVSQASGIPTGGLIERGDNANGEYVRFADGTQICTRIVVHDNTSTEPVDYSFPAAFVGSNPSASISLSDSVFNTRVTDFLNTAVAAANSVWRVRADVVGFHSNTSYILTAIGRWF